MVCQVGVTGGVGVGLLRQVGSNDWRWGRRRRAWHVQSKVQPESRTVAPAMSTLALFGGLATCWVEAQAHQPNTQVKKHVTASIWDLMDCANSRCARFSVLRFFRFRVFRISIFSDFRFFGLSLFGDFQFSEIPDLAEDWIFRFRSLRTFCLGDPRLQAGAAVSHIHMTTK